MAVRIERERQAALSLIRLRLFARIPGCRAGAVACQPVARLDGRADQADADQQREAADDREVNAGQV